MRYTDARQKELALPIFQAIQDSSYLQDILVIATSDAQKTFFISKLLTAVPDAFAGRSEPPSGLFDIMTVWFGKYKDSSPQFSAMEDALQQRKNYFTIWQHKKIDFICRIGLDWTPDTRDTFLGLYLYQSSISHSLKSSIGYVRQMRSTTNGETTFRMIQGHNPTAAGRGFLSFVWIPANSSLISRQMKMCLSTIEALANLSWSLFGISAKTLTS